MTEIEIKLQIPTHQHSALHDFLKKFELHIIPLHAKYYETPNHDLARNHSAIRVRREGDHWIQMLKAKGESDLHRLEFEVDLGTSEDAQLDLQHFENITEAKQFLDRVLGNNYDHLHLQFETDVKRTQAILNQGSSQIELSLDIGHIRSKGKSIPLYEIEFELKKGQVYDLIELCKSWMQQFELWIDVRSKAERGHLLAQSQAVSPAKAYIAPEQEDLNAFLTAFHRTFLSNIAAMIDGVAESAHIDALKNSLMQFTTQLDQLNIYEPVITKQIQNWQQHMRHLLNLSTEQLATELATPTTQLMLLEQMQVLYQSRNITK